jgi:outer membrane protein TolC
LQEQEAQVRAAAVRLADLRHQIAADVESALADVASGEAQQNIAVEQVQLATEELREARLRFQNGIAGNIEVVNAQSDLSHARSALVEAQAHTAAARVRLARAVGVAPTLQ